MNLYPSCDFSWKDVSIKKHICTNLLSIDISSLQECFEWTPCLGPDPPAPQTLFRTLRHSSQLPTHLVCREARRSGLTVALSGDGGDELFGGYNRYFWGPRIWNRLAWLPWFLRLRLGLLIRRLPPAGWDSLGRPLPIHQLGHKAHKLVERLQNVCSPDALYRSLVSEWHDPSALLQASADEPPIQEPSSPLDWPLPAALSGDAVARMMAFDTLNYLPNDILTKVDRAAMATSLETRSPFLDHHVAEVAWRLPMDMKIRPVMASVSGLCVRSSTSTRRES